MPEITWSHQSHHLLGQRSPGNRFRQRDTLALSFRNPNFPFGHLPLSGQRDNSDNIYINPGWRVEAGETIWYDVGPDHLVLWRNALWCSQCTLMCISTYPIWTMHTSHIRFIKSNKKPKPVSEWQRSCWRPSPEWFYSTLSLLSHA